MVKEACLVHVQTQKQLKKQLGKTKEHILCEKHTWRVQLSKRFYLMTEGKLFFTQVILTFAFLGLGKCDY